MNKELSTPTLIGIGVLCLTAFVFAGNGDYEEAKRQEVRNQEFRKWYEENCITKTKGYIASLEVTQEGKMSCVIYKKPGPADVERRVISENRYAGD